MGKITKWILVVAGLAACVVAVNIARVNGAATTAARYQDDITSYAYYRFGIIPDSIVFDLRSVGWGASQVQVLGVFLRFAREMKDRDFREVRLSYRGRTKFILGGDEFSDIGQEYQYQNPVYTIRTFPEKLRTPDGRRAFSTWSGGLLGVVGQQMEDVNALGRRWYLDDMSFN